MAVEVQMTDFRRALGTAISVIERRSSIPIVGSVKVEANGALRMSATNLDTQIDVSVPYQGDHGEFIIPHPQRVLAVCKQAGADSVTLAPGNDLSVRSGAVAFDVCAGGMKAEDFPSLGHYAPTWGATIGEAFFDAIHRVRAAISKEETRYYLNGVFFEKVGDWDYRLVATDGHRMMIQEIALPDAGGEFRDCIIPREAVKLMVEHGRRGDPMRLELCRRVPENEAGTLVTGGGSPTGIALAADGFKMTAKLIDGTFPDYRRVIPSTPTEKIVRFKRADLAHALKMIAIGKVDRCVRFAFELGRVMLSVVDPSVGRLQMPVPCEHKCEGFVIGMQRRYVADMIAATSGEEIDFSFREAHDPAIISDPADPTFTGIQMPMRF